MEVVVGTYNHILFGFKFHIEEKAEKKTWQFEPLFTDQGHAGCIKTVSCGGRYLASGSTDETIRLFDMKKHIEVGTLSQQDGTITSIQFCGSSHMLTGSEDGTICIWKSKSWELEKVLKGHRGAVTSISLHPSGRLALSVSKDKSIKTWNLLTGRPAYTTNIKEVGEIVCWSPKGDCYAIVVGCRVTVYKIGGVQEPVVYTCDKYILAMTFINDSVLLLAGEMDDVILYNFEKKLVLQRIEAHKIRTKAVCLTSHPDEENKLFLFTIASDGNLKAWSLNKGDLMEAATLLASLDMPARPTCITVKVPPVINNSKEVNVKEISQEEKVENSKEGNVKEISQTEEEMENSTEIDVKEISQTEEEMENSTEIDVKEISQTEEEMENSTEIDVKEISQTEEEMENSTEIDVKEISQTEEEMENSKEGNLKEISQTEEEMENSKESNIKDISQTEEEMDNSKEDNVKEISQTEEMVVEENKENSDSTEVSSKEVTPTSLKKKKNRRSDSISNQKKTKKNKNVPVGD